MSDAASDDGICDVFVYGTLMPGRLRWPLVEDYVVERWQDTVAGLLYDTGRGYPGAVFGGAARIPGWGLRFAPDTFVEVISLLDDTEGPHLYRRRVVATGVGRPAWAYEMLRDPDGMTLIDAWGPDRDEA